MNAILSLLLALAVLLGGAGELPELPQRAAQWTVRDIHVQTEAGEFDLEPEPVLRLALGERRFDAGFEVRSGEDKLLPLALRVEPEELCLWLGGEQVYAFTAEDVAEMLDLSPDELAPRGDWLAWLGDAEGPGGALFAQSLPEDALSALRTAGAEISTGEMEAGFDDEARHVPCAWVELDSAALIALDGEKEGDPVLGLLADMLLDDSREVLSSWLYSNAELLERLEGENAHFRLATCAFEEDGRACAGSVHEAASGANTFRCAMWRELSPDGARLSLVVGDGGDSSAIRLECAPSGGTLEIEEDGGRLLALRWRNGTAEDGRAVSDVELELPQVDVTTEYDFQARCERLALRFRAERAEVDAADEFVDRARVEMASLAEGENSLATAGLFADVAQRNFDATRLAALPNVAEMLRARGHATEVQVSTLEEAAGFYRGELPEYEAPEGWEVDEIWASYSDYTIHYRGPGNGFALVNDAPGGADECHIAATSPSTGETVWFRFDKAPSPELANAALAGLK